MYDLLIKNGRIADGTKKEGFIADLAVKEGKIVSLKADLQGEAKSIINADGLIVSPGFIDNHSHSDFTLLSERRFDNMVEQGITTEIVGQCGATLVPMTCEDLTKFAELKGFKKKDLKSLSKNFRTFEDYVAYLENIELGDNWAFYAGHCTIRRHVLGHENRPPSSKELDEMKDHVQKAMEAGALGVSTGLIYPPGSYADTDELVALLKVASEYGGNYTTHLRNEGDTVIESIKEALAIGEQAGVPVNISHIKVFGKSNWHKVDEIFELIEKAQSRGMKVRADMYPYLAGYTGLMSALPNKFASKGPEKLVERLKSHNFRQTVWEELQTGTGFENFIDACGFGGIMVLTAPVTKDLIGKNIAEIADERKVPSFDALCDILVENNGGVYAGYFGRCEDELTRNFSQPYVMGGTDGSIDMDDLPLFHPRCSGTFPRLIRKYVKEQKIISIEEAVHKLSYLPADMAGLKTKGLIKEGYDADLAIFDLDRLTDHADYIHPGAKNEGMNYVIVNGKITVEDDRFIGIHAGKVLRKS